MNIFFSCECKIVNIFFHISFNTCFGCLKGVYFTQDLLEQFLEDMVAYAEKFCQRPLVGKQFFLVYNYEYFFIH